jgi:hypothetical protein
VVLGVAVAAAVLAARAKVREEQRIVESAVDDIEGQLTELDPVARAAVLARLAGDARDVVAGRDAG